MVRQLGNPRAKYKAVTCMVRAGNGAGSKVRWVSGKALSGQTSQVIRGRR